MKIYSTSLVIREIQIKPQLDTTAHSLECLKPIQLTTPKAGQDVENYHCHKFPGEIAMYSQFGKQFGKFL